LYDLTVEAAKGLLHQLLPGVLIACWGRLLQENAHSHETKTPLYRSGRKKIPLTISGLKKWIPDSTYGHELSRPKRVSWLPADGMM
jgi:hypothetical protein